MCFFHFLFMCTSIEIFLYISQENNIWDDFKFTVYSNSLNLIQTLDWKLNMCSLRSMPNCFITTISYTLSFKENKKIKKYAHTFNPLLLHYEPYLRSGTKAGFLILNSKDQGQVHKSLVVLRFQFLINSTMHFGRRKFTVHKSCQSSLHGHS